MTSQGWWARVLLLSGYVLHATTLQLFFPDNEASQSDEEYVKLFQESPQVLCRSGTPAHSTPIATRYSQKNGVCENGAGWAGELVVLRGVRMRQEESETILSVPPCEQRTSRSWAAPISATTLGDSRLENEDTTDLPACDLTIDENTILLLNPRPETFGGVFHNLEEVFALMETAEVLHREPRDFRVLLAYTDRNASLITFAQPPDQLDGHLSFDAGFKTEGAARPSQAVPQLMDIYSKVAASGFSKRKMKLFKPLPSNLPRSAHVCFKKEVVLPMRACHGSVLTRTWSSSPAVHRTNHITMRYANHIAEDIFKCPASRKNGKKRVQIIVRHSHHGRNMQDQDLHALVAGLQLLVPGVEVDTAEFAEISMRQQICKVRQSDLLLGVHGSGLTHMIYLPPGASVLELTPYPVPYPGWSYANFPRHLAKWTQHPYQLETVGGGEYVTFDVEEVTKKAALLLDHP